MTETPILAHPDYEKEFILYTDASYTSLGFILTQLDEQGREHPVRYEGRKLQPAERNYTITDLECLGIVWGVRKNVQFLGQNKFKLITDHKALETLRKQELSLTARRTRWILELEQYNFDIEHRKGKKIAHVDAISRIPYNEAPVISGPLRVTFEEEPERRNLPGIVAVEERDDYVTLCDPLGLATVPWWEEPPLVKLANKEDEALFILETEPDYVLTILYNEERIYMSQRKNPKKPIYLKYQVPCGKVDPRESSLQVAWRETKEETDLALPAKRFQFLGNDEDFNCDMYAVHLLPHEVPQRTEPQNMTVWMYYPWTVWYKMAQQGRTTPSLTKFRDLIWETTH